MIRIADIISFLNEKEIVYDFEGNKDEIIDGFSSFQNYRQGSITWLKKDVANKERLPAFRFQCVILEKGVSLEAKNKIICEGSRRVFYQILQHFWGEEKREGRVGTGTEISRNARIDPTVTIGSYCVIRGNVTIKRGTVIEDHVVIDHCLEIGEDCILHSGIMIGTDGFGYTLSAEDIPQKVPHFGKVRIGDRVEIGANSCIDRGTIDDTEIDNDTKIDNLVQIAHNVQIGKGVMIVAGATICGSVEIGDGSYVAPNAVIKNGVKIGRDSFVGMGMVIHKDVTANTMCFSDNQIRNLKGRNYRRLM